MFRSIALIGLAVVALSSAAHARPIGGSAIPPKPSNYNSSSQTNAYRSSNPQNITPTIPIPPPVATDKSGGSSAGKVKFNEFTITKMTDIASPR